MKKIVPFTKDIKFNTKIYEITSISLEHNLTIEENNLVSGEFIISGEYKITDSSINSEPFIYGLPFDITLDTKYDMDRIKIDIDDFKFEIVNEEILRVNIDVLIEGIELVEIEEEKEISEEIKPDLVIDSRSNSEEEIKKEESHLTLTELIDMVLDKSGMKKSLEDEKSIEADIRLENLEEFKSIAKAMEINEGIVSLEELLDKLALVSDVSEQKNDNEDKVTLMTMHAVKGLEYDYVFVVGVEEGLFPHSNSLESNDELEEERRLCYVAITRAKKKLYLINARSRILYGKVSSNVPSRFINEISDEYIETIGKKEDINVFKPKIDKNKMMNEDNDLHPGDMVNHDKYGFGVVVTIDGSIATISFKRDGLKKLMKNHKSIHKM